MTEAFDPKIIFPVTDIPVEAHNPRADVLEVGEPGLNKVHKLARGVLTAVEGVIITAEMLPINEAMRFAALGAAQAVSHNSLFTAAVYGAATVGIEGAAGIATADALANGGARKPINGAYKFMEKLGLRKDVKTSPLTKAAAAMVGGTTVSMLLKDREEQDRSFNQNAIYGVKSAVSLGGMCAIQGYFISKGIAHPQPETIGAAAFAFVGARFVGKRLLNRGKQES